MFYLLVSCASKEANVASLQIWEMFSSALRNADAAPIKAMPISLDFPGPLELAPDAGG